MSRNLNYESYDAKIFVKKYQISIFSLTAKPQRTYSSCKGPFTDLLKAATRSGTPRGGSLLGGPGTQEAQPARQCQFIHDFIECTSICNGSP